MMRFVRLFVALSFVAVGTTVAFTQYRRVEFDTARRLTSSPVPRSRRSLSVAMSSFEYHTFTNATVEDEREVLKSRMPPPFTENMTKLQVEFRELLEGILYTPKELSAVLNPRMRVVLEGIAASYYEPAVYHAFEILYEDYIPLRVAGRVVYRELRKVMDESKKYQLSQIDGAMVGTLKSRPYVEDCWSTFTQIVSDRELPLDELERRIGPNTMKYVLDSGSDSVSTETREKSSISFEHLMICLNNYEIRYSGDGSEESNSNTFVRNTAGGNLLQRALNVDGAAGTETPGGPTLKPKRQKYNDKYDDMLVQFSKWKPLIPSGDGRRLQILKGCFVGSENPAVVEALRIIYVDYGALRLSGDWIFKVVSALMGPIERRHKRRQQQLLKP